MRGQITPAKFYSIPLNEIHSFYDGIGRPCIILLSNDDKKENLLMQQKTKKLIKKNYFCCIKCSMFTKNINVMVLCYLRFLKNTKYGQIVLSHF